MQSAAGPADHHVLDRLFHYPRFAGWCGVAMQIVVAFLWWTGIDLFGVSCSFDTN